MTDASSAGLLFVASGGLGDAVLLAHVFPRFRTLAEFGERVTLVLRKDAAKMGFLFRGLAEIETVDYDRFAKSLLHRRRVIGALGVQRRRLVVSLDFLRHPKRDEALIARLPTAQRIAMVARPWPKYDRLLARNRRLYDRLYESGPAHLDKVVRWARFADWLTGTPAPPPVLRLPDVRLPAPATAARPFVVLIPFSAVRAKQPAPELFAAILRRLPPEFDVVVAGAPDDPARNPEFAPFLASPRVSFDASDFENLAARMRAARLVISADTAAMHLAVAVGAPTLCLASAAYVGEIVPYAAEITPANAHFLHTPMDCAGCLGACIHPLERHMFPCVARLGEAQVIDALERLLADGLLA